MKTNENRLQWKPSLSRSVAITAEQWVFRQHWDIVFLFPNKKKLFAPEYSKSIFAFIKTRMMNIIKSTKIKQGFFSFVIFFWLRYSLKLSSWFQEECLLSSWKKKFLTEKCNDSWNSFCTIKIWVSWTEIYSFSLFSLYFQPSANKQVSQGGKQTLCRNADMDIRPHCLHNIL